MIQISDMSNFEHGYNFFMMRPSKSVNLFIIIFTFIISSVVIWSLFFKMDDVVKTVALIRPANTISQVITLTGGELIEKNYTNDAFINAGDLLLSTDCSSDSIELENSTALMQQLQSNIKIAQILLKTIKTNKNEAPAKDDESYIKSQSFLLEYRQYLNQINELNLKLKREQSLPDGMKVAQRTEDIQNEIEQAMLKFNLWKNNKYIETVDNLNYMLQEKTNLQRRISDLDRTIKNSRLHAPISGKINELRKLNLGDSILSGEQILNIVPVDSSNLRAELVIDPSYIANVHIGQNVTLRFPGLPPSKFGKLDAEVVLIPADYSVTGEKAVFIVEAKIPNPYLTTKTGDKIFLRAGIGAEGRIVVAQDTVMNMFLKKLDFINSPPTLFIDKATDSE